LDDAEIKRRFDALERDRVAREAQHRAAMTPETRATRLANELLAMPEADRWEVIARRLIALEDRLSQLDRRTACSQRIG